MTTAALLAAALDLAARGWSVLPLRAGDKRPAFPGHTADGCTGQDPRCRNGHVGWERRATTDPDRIRRAWTARNWNIGVACGPSRLIVVDLDTTKPGKETAPPDWRLPGVVDGMDVLAVLAERAGRPLPLDTFTVRTARGGTHLYFRHPGGPLLRNTAGDSGGLGWLVDTRAHGGQVVAPGSTVDGRPYRVTNDREPAPLPGWLAGLLTPKPLPVQEPARVDLASVNRAGRYVRAAVTAELARVTEAPPGGRNAALYRASVALGQLVAGGAIGADAVTGFLTGAAERVGQKPGETARTIASGLRAGAGRPRTVAA